MKVPEVPSKHSHPGPAFMHLIQSAHTPSCTPPLALPCSCLFPCAHITIWLPCPRWPPVSRNLTFIKWMLSHGVFSHSHLSGRPFNPLFFLIFICVQVALPHVSSSWLQCSLELANIILVTYLAAMRICLTKVSPGERHLLWLTV